MTFAKKITQLEVKPGTVALTWIGQAGFLMKTATGKIILIDPCLTDYVYEANKAATGLGFKRLCQPLFDPEEIPVDYFISSHEHEDHFDVPMLPAVLENPVAKILCNAPSIGFMEKANLDTARAAVLQIGDELDLGDCRLIVTDCDHGDDCPDALGFLFDFGFTKIYYSGDTALTTDMLSVPLSLKPEVALLPINGEFGNLNSEEAAKYADMLCAKVCIPHHFFTFALHGGDPRETIKAFPKYAPNCLLDMLTPGEIRIFGKE